jgi:uncharacterized RDD family membrane protein YckC
VFAVLGLWLHRRREPRPTASVEKRERYFIVVLFSVLFVLAIACTVFVKMSVLYPVIIANFVIWTIGGFLVAFLCFLKGAWERFKNPV